MLFSHNTTYYNTFDFSYGTSMVFFRMRLMNIFLLLSLFLSYIKFTRYNTKLYIYFLIWKTFLTRECIYLENLHIHTHTCGFHVYHTHKIQVYRWWKRAFVTLWPWHLNKCSSRFFLQKHAGLKLRVQCVTKKIFLFLNQNICCGWLKEPSQWDGSFEHPKHMLKLQGKKILTILR